LIAAFAASAHARAERCGADLCVGPGFALKHPSDAAARAKNGQSIGIAAGIYKNDVAVFRQNNLVIRGIGGYARLRVDSGVSAEGKAIWVIKGNHTTIEQIEFAGAHVPDKNGAGIRLEGAHLKLRRCYFRHNENGILTGRNLDSDVVIEHSEFFGGGEPGGSAHGIYVGEVRSLTLRFNYFHHARFGHLVKSRAHTNYILYNRIMDEAEGKASYAIDLPNGGLGILVGNLIQQGAHHENDALIAFGAERTRESHAVQELFVVNNTMVNDAETGRFVFAPYPSAKITLVNNVFAGPGTRYATHLGGQAIEYGNVSLERNEFADASAFDYRLRARSKAINAGAALPALKAFDLKPKFEYAHKARSAPRKARGPLDAGALEFVPQAR
jgi:hypothetical protein